MRIEWDQGPYALTESWHESYGNFSILCYCSHIEYVRTKSGESQLIGGQESGAYAILVPVQLQCGET